LVFSNVKLHGENNLMKTRYSYCVLVTGLAATIVFSGCRQRTADDYVERLPDLPANLAATLDPVTLATKTAGTIPPPEKASGPFLAPCCSITDEKSLKVNYPYTKCGPLRDFIVAPLGDTALFRSNPETTKVYKLRELSGKRLLDLHVCVTSQGPWNATLVETRSCTNYTPRQTLTINAYGDLVQFVWNGGVQGHPAEVQLVSCRLVATTRFPCGGLSTCDCSSSVCQASAPCECNLQW
jgi:hypothetical protein